MNPLEYAQKLVGDLVNVPNGARLYTIKGFFRCYLRLLQGVLTSLRWDGFHQCCTRLCQNREQYIRLFLGVIAHGSLKHAFAIRASRTPNASCLGTPCALHSGPVHCRKGCPMSSFILSKKSPTGRRNIRPDLYLCRRSGSRFYRAACRRLADSSVSLSFIINQLNLTKTKLVTLTGGVNAETKLPPSFPILSLAQLASYPLNPYDTSSESEMRFEKRRFPWGNDRENAMNPTEGNCPDRELW